MIVNKIGRIAEKCSSQLLLAVVAFGDEQDFPLMNMMVHESKEYRSSASLLLPSMSLSEFELAVSLVSFSVTQSQHEMTNVVTLQQ
jgi:hypothetical protein